MADDFVTQRRAEGKVRAQGKKGIRTKATIKNNNWDQKFTKGDFVVYGSEKVVYSLNKQGRWEEVARLRAEIAAQPREHTEEEPAAASETTSEQEVAAAAPPRPPIPVVESVVHADHESRALKPNPNRTKDHAPVKSVIDVKSHSSSDPIIDNASSKHMGVNIPRHGFSGGGFITSAGGRNFFQKRGVYCGDCCTQIGTIECPADEAEATQTSEAKKQAQKAPETQEAKGDEESDDKEDNQEDEDEEEEEEEEEEEADDGEGGESEEEEAVAVEAKESQAAGAPAGKGRAKDVGTRRMPGKEAVADREDWAEEGEVWVQHSFKYGEYPLFRETRTQHSTPCMGCFISQGPVWMLRGMGDKARKKTKGFKKITRRDLSLHTD